MNNRYSRKLLKISIALVLGGLVAAIIGHIFIALLCIIAGMSIHIVCWAELPTSPFTKGMITVRGRRTNVVVQGRVLIAPYFPFFIGINPFPMQLIPHTYELKNLRCKGVDAGDSGGLVNGTISTTFGPDPDNLDRWDDLKREKGFIAMMENVFESHGQEIANTQHWKDMERSGRIAAKDLWTKLSNVRLPDYKESDPRVTTRIPEYGVILYTMSVKFVGEDRLREAASGQALEAEQRETERRDMLTDMDLAETMLSEYQRRGVTTMDLHKCLVEVRNLKAIRERRGFILQGNGQARVNINGSGGRRGRGRRNS